MKKTLKDIKLKLHRETLLALEHPELQGVAGGASIEGCTRTNCNTCQTTCC